MNQLHKRLSYANVMSSIAVFLVLGGATAFAASSLAKNSVGAKQLKANAVTAAKIKKNAVTAAKIKNGAITGAKVNLATLGTVPNSATTNVVKASKGTLTVGQEVTALEYGPLKISIRCETLLNKNLSPRAFISSATDGSVFSGWMDGSSNLGPATPEAERELSGPTWADSEGAYAYDNPADAGVSASAANGQGFNALIGMASEKNTNTCWYWLTATTIG